MNRSGAAIAGVAAVLTALGVTELVAGFLPSGRSVFVTVADAIIEVSPGAVVRFAIDRFAGANRLALSISIVAVMFAAGLAVGAAGVRRGWLAPASFGGFALLAVAAGAGQGAGVETAAAALPGAAAGTATLRWLWSRGAAADVQDRDDGPAGRRRFLIATGSVAAAAVAFLATGRSLQQRTAASVARLATRLPAAERPLPAPPADASLDVAGVSPLVTPNDEFYRIDTAFSIPRIDPASHVVRVTGLVDTPYEITYEELLDLATTEADVTLACVSNEVGGDLIGTARWLGVPLGEVLDRAGVRSEADQVVGRSVDGWTAGFPVEVARDGRPAMLAVGMNGEPLPDRHGFPVRLVVAGLYGYVSDTKWLSEIELTTFDAFDAYWVPRGWSALGPIKTQSRIDVPRRGAALAPGTVAVAGVAWAGIRGVRSVEVSVDDGAWRPAELAAELATTTWRQWLYRWEATSGRHVLRVRATDGDGRLQTARAAPPVPDGATGHHTVPVVVA